MNEFNKSCLDEIDFSKAEQMHAATLQISKTSFDFKKLCVSFLGATMAFIINFTNTKIDHILFVVGLVLILGFWISDATGYYYQRRLRYRIEERFQEIAIRNQAEYSSRVEKPTAWKSLFNHSMWLYYILGFLFLGAWGAFATGCIG